MQLELIPPGLCQCGCGKKTPVAARNRRGHRKGEPMHYLTGHNARIDARKPQHPSVAGMKVCLECHEAKPVREFPTKREQGKRARLSHLCENCQIAYKRQLYLRKRWGFEKDEWEQRFNAQGRVCAVCGTDKPGHSWHVDHDHACCSGNTCCGKCVRGILCHRCNTGLGLLEDSPELLQRACCYLEAARKE